MDRRLQSYTGRRNDVLALVRGAPRRALDIGCSDGTLLAGLDGPVERTGIELDPDLAGVANKRLDEVIRGDAVEVTGELGRAGRRFDLVICADILEHLAHPEGVLENVATMLEPGGQMLVSLPNVRFWTTFWEVGIRGRWPRRSRGVHDATHLRWFTDQDAREMFADSGFHVDEAKANTRLFDDPNRRGNGLARYLAHGPIRPFLTYQNLYRLVMA
mgnify:CR=1 FL=1|jgi:2-polyprenyl-3-methyl-5-hydroxy-6-metoxy-1,4-benzoquinol methylase